MPCKLIPVRSTCKIGVATKHGRTVQQARDAIIASVATCGVRAPIRLVYLCFLIDKPSAV